MIRKFCGILLSAVIVINTPMGTWGLSTSDITAPSAILMDQNSGRILFEKNPDEILYPASTTKVLTALMILEDCKLSDVVTIDAQTPFVEGARIYLIEGEKVSVEQLLYALLLPSANDAAIALAKFHSDTVESFADAMNKRAKALGATHTHFTNPNGLPDPNHVTTAHDMALISQKAMENPKFREIVSTLAYAMAPTNKQPEIRHFVNANRFLRGGTGWHNRMDVDGETVSVKWDLADGIKTGYTDQARQCLISSASQNGRRVIAVVLKAEGQNMYIDSRKMLESGLNDYVPFHAASAGQDFGMISIPGTKNVRVSVQAQKELVLPIEKSDSAEKPIPELIVQSGLKLPIHTGEIVGAVQYHVGQTQLGEVPLVASEDVQVGGLNKNMGTFLKKATIALLVLSGILLSLLLGWRCWATWDRAKRLKRKRSVWADRNYID